MLIIAQVLTRAVAALRCEAEDTMTSSHCAAASHDLRRASANQSQNENTVIIRGRNANNRVLSSPSASSSLASSSSLRFGERALAVGYFLSEASYYYCKTRTVKESGPQVRECMRRLSALSADAAVLHVAMDMFSAHFVGRR